ncbi:MAG: hypothetical protein NTW08_07645 [Gammaproteobacteria bacterium]|nr:hypothetical protein [Gammaproteobacteria bacterium]
MSKVEFSRNQPLQLGNDIDCMATDTEEKKERLLAFLVQHDLQHIIRVMLFDELRALSYRPDARVQQSAHAQLSLLAAPAVVLSGENLSCILSKAA